VSRTPLPSRDPLDETLAAFVEAPVPALSPNEAREMRARVLAGLDFPSANARVRRGARYWASFAVAVAAPLVAVAALWVALGPSPRPRETEVHAVAGDSEIAARGSERPLVGAAALGADDELRTGSGGAAHASLPTGAQVEVGPLARVRFAGSSGNGRLRDRIELAAGRIAVAVPKLASGDEVRVRTDDATVVVHGTRFSVERVAPSPGRPLETRVAVTEGRVLVSTERGIDAVLTAGDTWVGSSPSPSPSASDPDDGDGGPSAARAADPTSTLSVENAILTDAIRLARDHRPDRALARLDSLLAQYPSSPLVETARIERLRALDSMGDKQRLRVEAERYLSDYPQGSWRPEASRLVAQARGAGP
jgi:hypothetical protein